MIPPGTPGLEMGTKVKKLGLRASHTADVFLDDVRVPGACLLGGKEKLDERLARAREGTSAAVAGRDAHVRAHPARPSAPRRSASRARRTSTRWSTRKDRVQFGRPIIENQAIAFALADMRMEIDAARLLVWRAAWMGRNNRPFDSRRGLDDQAQGRRGRACR